ncbi:MAG: acyl-CoA dehydrogenase family protein, partial [Hyphomicrobiales bacterium]
LTVQPLITMSGDHVFNQEFFDDVRVPARNLVGEENRGWYIGAALLDFERSNIANAIGIKHSVNDLANLLRERVAAKQFSGNLAEARTAIAERAIEAEIARLISYRVISIQKRGEVPNYEASMNKLYGSEVRQRVAQTGMRILGLTGGLYRGEPRAPRNGAVPHSYLSSVSATIAAGTSEVNRNVIATRGLGLPRS